VEKTVVGGNCDVKFPDGEHRLLTSLLRVNSYVVQWTSNPPILIARSRKGNVKSWREASFSPIVAVSTDDTLLWRPVSDYLKGLYSQYEAPGKGAGPPPEAL
jgi:hypothetical protein